MPERSSDTGELDLERLADAIAARVSRPILVDTRGAAQLLGMGLDTFKRDVAPQVACIRRGEGGKGKGRALRLYLVADLERWADENATRITDDLRAPGAA